MSSSLPTETKSLVNVKTKGSLLCFFPDEQRKVFVQARNILHHDKNFIKTIYLLNYDLLPTVVIKVKRVRDGWDSKVNIKCHSNDEVKEIIAIINKAIKPFLKGKENCKTKNIFSKKTLHNVVSTKKVITKM